MSLVVVEDTYEIGMKQALALISWLHVLYEYSYCNNYFFVHV